MRWGGTRKRRKPGRMQERPRRSLPQHLEARYYRDCVNKSVYGSKEAAAQALPRVAEYLGVPRLWAYKCPFCKLWHHTTRSK